MWPLARDIPNNMVSVCSHINILGNNVRMFEKQRNEDGQKKKGTSSSNVLFFSFAIAFNIEPAMYIGLDGIK